MQNSEEQLVERRKEMVASDMLAFISSKTERSVPKQEQINFASHTHPNSPAASVLAA